MSQTTTRNSYNWIFVLLIAIVLLIALWTIRGILLLAFAAVLLTVFATAPVRIFERWGMNRGVAILLSVFLGILLIVVAIMLVFPTLIQQFSVLFTDIIPRGVEQLIEEWNSGRVFDAFPFLEDYVQNFVIDTEVINQIATQLGNALGTLGGSVLPIVGSVANTLLSILIIIFLSMYFLAEPRRYISGIIAMTPKWYRTRMQEILEVCDDTIRAWLRVTGASMLLVGIGTAIGLALIGVEQWAALGVLAGVLSFVPNFGPLMALIPSIAVAIIQAPENTLWVIFIIYGMSFLQSQIVGPLLANESMKLAPVLILIGQVVFGVFFGFLGIMLAVPLTALGVVLISEIYIKDFLGDRLWGSVKPVEEAEYMEELMPSPD
ncbi:MAG: AI-2E family transporter [Anaerolineae bacterium]|nr:AI-2E family transporter [Anaerolineae bacterium]